MLASLGRRPFRPINKGRRNKNKGGRGGEGGRRGRVDTKGTTTNKRPPSLPPSSFCLLLRWLAVYHIFGGRGEVDARQSPCKDHLGHASRMQGRRRGKGRGTEGELVTLTAFALVPPLPPSLPACLSSSARHKNKRRSAHMHVAGRKIAQATRC